MLAACSNCPARSSSKPCPIACPRITPPGASASARPTATPVTTLLLRGIEPAEVVEHQATLFRRESLQLVARGVADPRTGAGRTGLERGGNVDGVARRRPALTLLVLVRLVGREGAAGVAPTGGQTPLAPRRPLGRAPRPRPAGRPPRPLGRRGRP